VISDKQTLILAGEAIPRRVGESRLTIIATRADDTMLLARHDPAAKHDGGESPSLPVIAPPIKLAPSGYLSSSRSASLSPAYEYIRTQELSLTGTLRTGIIDTYA
jgi:hypothetical protein